ncbi:MAG: copper resistance protein NlpE [Tannerellaceae bacterium]|jgi:uncharacterized lipoprotein NlpE involved in copper resistance|nr:copper resistance protein NlpE [Tannerellaceae bacterium]
MKKIYCLLGIAILLASCNTKKNDTKDNAIVEEETVVVTEPLDARYSSNIDGIYEGELPTASAGGMNVKVILSGNTYEMSITYLGKPDAPVVETSGEFTWNDESTIITLTGEEAPNKYLVGENTLTCLDADGNIITGELADMYILKKK